MVIKINLDELDLEPQYIARLKLGLRSNNLMIDERTYTKEPDCPNVSCEQRGDKWECYQGFYNQCEVYRR